MIVVDQFVSKKLVAFLVSLGAGFASVWGMSPEQSQTFLTYLQWLSGFYFVAQGGIDAMEKLKAPGKN